MIEVIMGEQHDVQGGRLLNTRGDWMKTTRSGKGYGRATLREHRVGEDASMRCPTLGSNTS